MTINKSEATDKIIRAMFKAKASITAPVKNSRNPAFKSKYADLRSVISAVEAPALSAGLMIVQSPISDDDVAGAETYIMHESGQWISSRVVFQLQRSGPQGAGSCITYARRYALMSLFGLAADDDDDANAAERQRAQHRSDNRPKRRAKGQLQKEAAMKFLADELFGRMRANQNAELKVAAKAISAGLASTMATKRGEEVVGKRVIAAINMASELLDDDSHHTSDVVPMRNAMMNAEDLDETNSMAWLAFVRGHLAGMVTT